MKIRPLLYIGVLLFISSIHAQRQSVLKTADELAGYQKIPQEKVFIHYNTTVLFAGEYLYYRLYCLNTKTGLFSNMSKVAYVELIDEKKQVIFKHKVILGNGLGQGDFFLPVSVPSGNYKLLGYTQWMLNAKSNIFFEGDISILNPYQGNQKAILSDDNLNDSLVNSIHTVDVVKPKITPERVNSSIDLKVDKQVFQKRSPVVLTIGGTGSRTRPGNYSISVRKKNSFISAQPITTNDFAASISKPIENLKKVIKSSIFLPEMRGELIYGKVIPKHSGLLVTSPDIVLSVPGKTNDVKIISTDEEGVFVFYLDKIYTENNVVIQVLGEHKKEYNIELNEAPQVDYPNFSFYKFKITKELKDEIIKRSVYNQVENKFFSVKPDTIQELKNNISFYGTNYTAYNLDDYTRFPSVKETIIEVVEHVWIRKNKKGENRFAIRGYYPTQEDYNIEPLLIIDGVVEQEHEEFIDYDARKIKNIGFVRDRYFLGPKIYKGVLIFETLKGDYVENLRKDYLLKTTLSRPQTHKNYYIQQYNTADKTYDRIPDFRNQLLWKPNVVVQNESINLEFSTSDVAGEYEISLEGYTNNGLPVSIKKYIKVE